MFDLVIVLPIVIPLVTLLAGQGLYCIQAAPGWAPSDRRLSQRTTSNAYGRRGGGEP